ncbi:NADH oxidase [Teratosphaeria destructans]|uniref:NADH oxidase n=1 Tax=Teratosphaeria destructans TaxID=418781 RepID=A0A9W7T064_9PEZI|nr:NADH oxidase [Teratosphaeria destructans]
MEYDKSTVATAHQPEAEAFSHTSTSSSNDGGRLRVHGPSVDTTVLRDSITFPFSGRIAKNRFLKAPMTERLCHFPIVGSPDEDITCRGYPTDAYKHLYQRWGEGEIGVIRYGSLFIAQLSHPGRQGSAALNPNPVSASDVHLKISWAGNSFNQPRALTIPEIKENVKFWGETASLCHQAGFDGVQVHCAHGYLLAQFLSLTTNKRTDEYGGNFANRSRIIFEIIDEIRRRVPDPSFIICVKLNSVEFQPGGQTPEDCKNLCLKLEEAGVDFVDLSGGTFESRAFEHKKESTKKRESYFIEFAEMIRPLLKKTKVYVTGGFRTASGMVRAVEDGACDGVGIGRPLGAEPYLCKEILEGRVQGAIENLMPLPLNTQGTGTQLQQVGNGDAMISDWSDEGEVKRWIEVNEKETDRKTKLLPKVDSSGYPVLKAEAGFVYMR